MKLFIDLFCGLGGASSGFVGQDGWRVIRVDSNPDLVPHVRGMILADITDVENLKHILARLMHVEEFEELVLWASPPCDEFSFANPNRPEHPNLDCLMAAIELKDWLLRTYTSRCKNEPIWLIENVKGAIKIFDEEIGQAWKQRIGPVFLWGNFTPIDFKDAGDRSHNKSDKGNWTKGSRALRPNLRAMIPEHVSHALRNSIRTQLKLHDYFQAQL